MTVKLAAEGQRERTQSQALSVQLQSLPQVQQGYSTLTPSLSNYARPQLATSAPQTLSFSAYTPLAYGTQSAYGGLTTTPQYGGLSTSPQPYNPSQYAQYTAFGSQSNHAVIPTVASIQGGSLSSYYTGSNWGLYTWPSSFKSLVGYSYVKLHDGNILICFGILSLFCQVNVGLVGCTDKECRGLLRVM